MKCTCDKWKQCDKENALMNYYVGHSDASIRWSVCPWCGSPLLPDPVEKTEWRIKTVTLGGDKFYETFSVEKEAMLGLKIKGDCQPSSTHTLKSITTIERTIRIVKPK